MDYCGVFGSSMSQHSCIGYHDNVFGTAVSAVAEHGAHEVFDLMPVPCYTHQVFGEMPTPNSGHRTHVIAPGYWNYSYRHQNPILNSCVQDGSTTFSQHYLERMPQQYGFHNLNRQSVFLIDGTEHSYYVLPENYSFECTTSSTSPAMPTAEVSNSCQSFTPPKNDQISEEETHPGTETQSICDMLAQIQSKLQTMSENLRQDLKHMKSWETKRPAAAQPNHLTQEAINMSDEMPLYDVYDEEDNSCSTGICSVLDTSLVNQQDGESEADTYPLERAAHGPVFDAYDDETDGCSHEFVDMFATNLDQQPYEEEQQASDQLLKCVSKATELKQTSSCLHSTSDVQVFSLELQQEDDERAYSCSDLKASDSVVTRSSQLSIEHSMRKLRLLWDPGASAYLHSSKAEPPRELSYVAILFPKVLALCNQVGNYVEQQLTDQLWNLLVVHERRREWDPGDIVDVLHTSILAEETSTHLTECNSLEYLLQSAEFRHPSILSYFFILRYYSVKCNSWLDTIIQYMCDQVEGLNPLSLSTPWNPGVLEIKDTMLSKSAVLNLKDLKHFRAQLLSQYYSLCATPNAFLQVLYCCLPIVLDCPYSETVQQLVCYFRMFSLTTDILSVMCSSTVTTVHMIVVLSSGKTAQEGSDAAVVYHVFKIQLPMSKTSHIWDPGIESLLFLYIWLHVYMSQPVNCCAIHACYWDFVLLPPTQMSTHASSNTAFSEHTSRCLGVHLHQINNCTSAECIGVTSSEYPYTVDFLTDQWEFVDQRGVHDNYKAKHLLLSSQRYLRIWEIDVIFVTFRPP